MSHNEVFPWDESPHARGPNQPVEFALDSKKQLVVVRFGGNVTAEDIRHYVERLLADPLFQPTFSEIVDLSAVEELDLQADDLLRLADEIDPFSDNAKRAFVVRNSVQNHAARMHRALLSRETIGIFRSFEEAERWICG
ncbi:MAG: hypothetical protein ACLQBK_11430 [Candidatus Sulfotelmatobacter sp.]